MNTRDAVIKENGLDWPSADILVGYDAKRNRVVYAKLSTGEPLLVYDAITGKEVKEEHCLATYYFLESE